MTARYVAVIGMFTAAAAATVGCAVAWGPAGRDVVLPLAAIAFLCASIGAVQLDRPPAPPVPPNTPGA